MKILNTRPREQAEELSRLLRAAGYQSIEVPLVELVLIPEATEELSRIHSDDYDGILLSSPNLVSLLTLAHVDALKTLAAKPWYLISSRARVQVEALGAKVAFVPRNVSLEGFLTEFPPQQNLRLLHPCSQATRLDPKVFAERRIEIRNIPVYAPHCPKDAMIELKPVWPQVQAILFASGSAVHNLFKAAPELGRELLESKGPFPISIGPSATEALQKEGVPKFRQADTADNAGFITALKTEFQNQA